MHNELRELLNPHAWRTAYFLTRRTIRHASAWQTGLVIGVMVLTFLNVVVVSGILVGLMDGALQSFKTYYAADVLITTLPEKEHIERSTALRAALNQSPHVVAYTERIIHSATLEANFQQSIAFPNLVPDRISVPVAGITVADEDAVTNLKSALIEGSFLNTNDERAVVLGARLLERHFPAEAGLQTISDVYPGDKIRLIFNTEHGAVSREYTVRGVIQTKAGNVDGRVFMTERELRRIFDVYSTHVDEIAVRTQKDAGTLLHNELAQKGFATTALIRTAEDAIGEFLDQIRDTFTIIGNIIGGISIIVASITVFIIIFITAITRRKFIGILKAIGISRTTIELSYVFLSLFYALIGITIGTLLLYGILVPYIDTHPIDFPFSNGVLTAEPFETALRASLILAATVCAGYIPARMITGKNTLDSVLGR